MPSRYERQWRLVVLALLAFAPLTGHVPMLCLLMAYVVFVGQASHFLRRPSTSGDIASLQPTATGWRLVDQRGGIYLVELHGPIRDWPGLLCLSFQQCSDDVPHSGTGAQRPTKPRRWRTAIWRDQLSAEQWRRLRVNVLWRRRPVPKSYRQRWLDARGSRGCNAGHATPAAPTRYG